ncbi:unnamed protein product [Gongylonema pulchrum]|uniref:Uncharacterized protein n=1 Tax=Gongylonema pulchrum TaxID=637853 RepID=A0A183DQB0_9BILA|nr:unnamed protein product [Gongylonema pulchrum]
MGPYRGPAYRQHMMQHAHAYDRPTDHSFYDMYPSGRQTVGPYLGHRIAHELYSGENTLPRRPQSSFDTSAYAK